MPKEVLQTDQNQSAPQTELDTNPRYDEQVVKEMTEYNMHEDPTMVTNPDPNLEYHWASHEALSKKSGRLPPGYFVIDNSHKERSADPKMDKIARYIDAPRDIHATDSAVRCGDMVLIACLKERAEDKRKKMAAENNRIYGNQNADIRNAKDLKEYIHEERKRAGFSEKDMKRGLVTVNGGLVMNGWR